ncbi:MAG: hypothetical protein A2Z49_08795 [Chloroflexi bacterium RBG_19FT_COMBO_56_12]|nr:MAG: hypothetical protein A2Z49_08795 [Chloroflexi bacterium RBG_19FT_COMBO_56_12]
MKTFNRSRKITPILLIIMLVIVQLACGSSTEEKLASAVPPTATADEAAESEQAQPESQKIEPTEPSKPTEIPSTEVPPTPTPEPEPISIVTFGFGQDERECGFAFIVENPNQNYAFESSQYQVAAYDANGTVVETDDGYIELVLPGQKLGIGGTMYLDEGVTVDKFEVQINAGDVEYTDLSAAFTTDKVIYQEGEYFSSVFGVITNPYTRDFSSLKVSTVAYNDAGEIIGGGYTYLDFILAMSSTGIDVSIVSAGQVARVELYPVVSGISMLLSDDELPEGAQNIAIVKSGYGQDGNEVGYGVLIENPNNGFSLESSMYHINLYGDDGNIIAVEEGYVNTLLPSQTLGIGGDIYIDEGLTVASADFQIKSGNFEPSEVIATFTSENISYKSSSYFPTVTGEIASPYSKDITNLYVYAIAYNEAGEIIGGGFTFLDFVPANSKAAVEVSITSAGVPALVELYAAVSALSDIE